MTFHKDQAHLSEQTALKEAVKAQSTKNQEDISVFDKGLKSRKTFAEFDDEQILFVARANEAPRYQFVKTHSHGVPVVEGEKDKDLTFVQDSIVMLYEGSTQINAKNLRLIQYKLNKTGEILSFVTNVLDGQAATIAQIYKMRWDIEVLFRFMKQEMNLSHFVCNDPNAIEVMLYCTLIASMLVLIYKKNNNITSYKKAKIQFFKELICDILLEMIDDPQASLHLKQILLKFKQK